MVGYRGTFAFGRDMSDVKVLNDVKLVGDGAGDERDDVDNDNNGRMVMMRMMMIV